MFDKLRTLLGFKSKAEKGANLRETINAQQVVEKIREREAREMATGKKIYDLDYGEFSILMDREFTGRYRISVFRAQHKVYGFTISEKEIADDQFERAWDYILRFLENPSPGQMPESELFDAHFFGHPK